MRVSLRLSSAHSAQSISRKLLCRSIFIGCLAAIARATCPPLRRPLRPPLASPRGCSPGIARSVESAESARHLEGRRSGKTQTITAVGKTDWFASPMGDDRSDNTPRLLFKPAERFCLEHESGSGFSFPVGLRCLVLYVNNSLWAKLCFEMTIEKHPAIVSVVTRDVSDDNNSIPIIGSTSTSKLPRPAGRSSSTPLRMARTGRSSVRSAWASTPT